MAKTSNPPDAELDEPTHSVDLTYVHPEDVIRVIGASETLDPAVVTSHWPYTQTDFNADRHREDVHVETVARTDLTTEPPESDTGERANKNGHRLTVVTRERTEYAVVDWAQTDSPPLIYLKVIDAADPEGVRWNRVDAVDALERYGPPPEDGAERYWTGPPGHTPKPWEMNHEPSDGDFSV